MCILHQLAIEASPDCADLIFFLYFANGIQIRLRRGLGLLLLLLLLLLLSTSVSQPAAESSMLEMWPVLLQIRTLASAHFRWPAHEAFTAAVALSCLALQFTDPSSRGAFE